MTRRSLPSLALLLLAGAAARAQTPLPLKLDVVVSPGSVPAGWLPIQRTTLYAPPGQPYGWLTAPTDQFDLASIPVDVLAQLGPQDAEHALRLNLFRDGVKNSRPIHFQADVPPGAYRVRVVLGYPADTVGGVRAPQYGLRVYANAGFANEQLVTHEVDPRNGFQGVNVATLNTKAQFNTTLGSTRTVWFTANVLPGNPLSIRFDTSSNPLGGVNHVLALEVHPWSEPPIFFDRALPGVRANPVYLAGMTPSDATSLQLGAQAITNGDYTRAKVYFDGIAADNLARACGWLWLAGWLTQPEESYHWDLTPVAINQLAALPEGARRNEYLDSARLFYRGLKHHKLRGYTGALVFPDSPVPVPNPAGASNSSLIQNLGHAEALFKSLGGPTIEAVIDHPEVEVNPLFFKALLLMGSDFHARNTQNSVGMPIPNDGYYYVKQHYTIWKGIKNRNWHNLLFFKCGELWPFMQMASPQYDENVPGGIIANWQGENRDTIYPPGFPAWWDDLLQKAYETPPPGAPGWAVSERRYREAFLAAVRWWNTRKFFNNEFGGGSGDDVEFALWHLASTAAMPGNEPDIGEVAMKVCDASLAPYGAPPHGTGKYFFGDGVLPNPADVEHTAEYTGNPLFTMLQLQRGNPFYLDYTMQATRHLDASPLGNSWTAPVPALPGVATHTYDDGGGPQPVARRRFLAWHLDAEGPSNSPAHIGDVVLNGRAVLPGYFLNAYNNNPTSKRLFREWAEWWWAVCMDDGTLTVPTGQPIPAGQRKPVGVPPGVVTMNGALTKYGDPVSATPQWWLGSYTFTGQLYVLYFLYGGLFLERYLDPGSPPAERADYLRPILESGKLVAELWREQNHPADPQILALGPSAVDGSLRWTAQQLLGSGSYLSQLSAARPFLVTDPFLALSPQLKGYFNEIISALGPSHARYVITGNKAPLVAQFDHGYDWLRTFFPLGTSVTAYTDRAFIFPPAFGGTHLDLFSAMTGGQIGANPIYTVTWEKPSIFDAALDLGMLVGGVQSSGGTTSLKVLLYNFQPDPNPGNPGDDRVVRMRFWNQMPLGTWRLEYGLNDGNDNILGAPLYVNPSVVVDRIGASVQFPVPYQQNLVLVLTQLGSIGGSAAFTDVGVGVQDLAVNQVLGSHVDLRVTFHNVGNQNVSAVPYQVGILLLPSTLVFVSPPGATLTLAAPNNLVPQTQDFTLQVPTPGIGFPLSFVFFGLIPVPDGNPDNNLAWGVFTIQ